MPKIRNHLMQKINGRCLKQHALGFSRDTFDHINTHLKWAMPLSLVSTQYGLSKMEENV